MIYTEENRGHVQSPRAAQVVEFIGMRFGKSTPTDIDGFIEKDNKAFVLFELKYMDAKPPLGQRMALMRLVDNLRIAGKESVLFIARHEVTDPHENVIAADAKVTEIYYCGRWRKYNGKPLGEMVHRFLSWAVKKGRSNDPPTGS